MIPQTIAVLRKELLVEWRSPSRFSGLFVFALALLLMVAFASPSEAALKAQAGGTLWLGLLLASTRSMDASWATEMEHDAAEGMLLWPVDARALFYGKAVANTLILLAVGTALLPLLIGMYGVEPKADPLLLVGFLVLGCASLAAPGTLYGAIVARARGSSVLLPLLLFPLVVPALLACARGTTLVLEGDPMLQAPSWLGLLAAFDAIHWSLSGLLFGRVLEDG